MAAYGEFGLAAVNASGRARGLALVDMTVVEQRYRAVLVVERVRRRTGVADQFEVSRQSVTAFWREHLSAPTGQQLLPNERLPGPLRA